MSKKQHDPTDPDDPNNPDAREHNRSWLNAALDHLTRKTLMLDRSASMIKLRCDLDNVAEALGITLRVVEQRMELDGGPADVPDLTPTPQRKEKR